MPAQTYTYVSEYGGGVVVAPCDVVFLAEVAHCNAIGLLPGLFNLGQRGDPRHAATGTGSDHNAFVQGPSGLWYIRAHDCGGPKSTRQLLNEFWNARYRARDPRVYPYGYTNSADPSPHGLTIWFSAGVTRQGTDGDHEHESLSRANTVTVGRAAWTPALDDRSPWGLEAWLRQRLGQPIGSLDTASTTDPVQEDDMGTLIYAPGRGWAHDGSSFVTLADQASVDGLKAAGVKSAAVSDRDFDRMYSKGAAAGVLLFSSTYGWAVSLGDGAHGLSDDVDRQKYLDAGFPTIPVTEAEFLRATKQQAPAPA